MNSISLDPKSNLTTLVLGTERGNIYILDFEGVEIEHQGFKCNSTPVSIMTSGSVKSEA